MREGGWATRRRVEKARNPARSSKGVNKVALDKGLKVFNLAAHPSR
jgi:hypothetical protein